jgi:hypothetical protein
MKEDFKKVRAICAWGDGIDVLVSLKKKKFMLYEKPFEYNKGLHGFVENGSFCLTSEEAITLAYDLLSAASNSKQLDVDVQNYFESQKDK